MSDLAPPDVEVMVEPVATVPNVRRAADVLRPVVALALLLVGVMVATLAHRGVRSSERGLLETIATLAPSAAGNRRGAGARGGGG